MPGDKGPANKLFPLIQKPVDGFGIRALCVVQSGSSTPNWENQPHCDCIFTFTLRAFSRRVCPTHTDIHTLMAVAAMQGADQHIRSSSGFSILPEDTSTCRPGGIEPTHWLYPLSSVSYRSHLERLNFALMEASETPT